MPNQVYDWKTAPLLQRAATILKLIAQLCLTCVILCLMTIPKLGDILQRQIPGNFSLLVDRTTFQRHLNNFIREVFYRTAIAGKPAPNAKLMNLKTKEFSYIHDLGRKGRPLVLNFGSCTWPPFIAALGEFRRVLETFSDVADFVIIYTSESHTADDVPLLGTEYDTMMQHKSFEDRVDAAERFSQRDIPCPIYVDGMDNKASTLYASIPDRLYILLDGVVVYVGSCGRTGPYSYKPAEVEDWLKKFKAERKAE